MLLLHLSSKPTINDLEVRMLQVLLCRNVVCLERRLLTKNRSPCVLPLSLQGKCTWNVLCQKLHWFMNIGLLCKLLNNIFGVVLKLFSPGQRIVANSHISRNFQRIITSILQFNLVVAVIFSVKLQTTTVCELYPFPVTFLAELL